MIENLDTALLQLAGVRGNVCKIIGNENNAMAKLMQKLKDLKHPERSRITVRHWKVMIDHQDVFRRRLPGLPKECQVAIGRLPLQLRGPCFRKCRSVNILVLLGAGREISSTSCSLAVNDLAQRLV